MEKIPSTKPWFSALKYVLIVLGLVVLALLIIDFNGRVTEMRRLTIERDRVRVHVTSLAQTQSSYQTQIAYATSPASVMNWAYQDGHWVRKGEYLVVPVPSGEATAVPTPTPVMTPQKVENWQLWLSLFVDSNSP